MLKTFLMLDRATGARTVPIEYRPFKVTVGDETHMLALHQSAGQWFISDPISGGGIARVYALHKGLPVSSKGLGVREATARARDTIAQLLDRVGGPDAWNARLAHARAIYPEPVAA